MREILFKAKRIDNGEWVEGQYIRDIDTTSEFAHKIQPLTYTQAYMFPIDLNTVCQYIGLTDKNGNKIWENDIVKVDGRLYIVHYYEPFAMYMLRAAKHGGGINGMSTRLFESEVIGNIFDNPELIGERK